MFLNRQGGLDQGLSRQAWLGKRQLPGMYQHRPFWGVGCVHRPHLAPRHL